ncbi:MAG: ribosome-associated ATPase/putative transporter RbbA [Planctomycetota bacterium]
MPSQPADSVAVVDGLSHRYGTTVALDGITLAITAGRMVGVIGPDGVGKSTLLSIVAGAKRIQSGRVAVLGGDMADARHRDAVCPRIAFMPQGLGRNLSNELSVFENVDFFARLFAIPAAERPARIAALLAATGLAPFPDRPVGSLSGGMKQKTGLCTALVHDPDLLILDEPTTGVDPLSRRQFWTLIALIRRDRPSMSVLVATADMEEAARFDLLVVVDRGRILAAGTPAELMARTGTATLEATYVALLPEADRGPTQALVIPPRTVHDGPPAIVARHLTKRFGDFVAVDDVSFEIARGEIFGFLGSNGCGKSTTMKMLTGLLPATSGEAILLGSPVEDTGIAARRRVGYMSQSFSLYGALTVRQNLLLHARLFHLPAARAAARIAELEKRFGLGAHRDDRAEILPLGVRQRLSLAVAVIHEPEMLILDEPTSGVDPVARDAFWELLVGLSREQGVTIFVSTHFMNEALRCDRISLMHAGRVIACDTPAALLAAAGTDDFEEAFIHAMADAAEPSAAAAEPVVAYHPGPPARPPTFPGLTRLLAYAHRESLEILRDPVRLAFAFGGSLLLMVVLGYGITTDVEQVRYAAFDQDRSPTSRDLVAAFAGSRSFAGRPDLAGAADLERRLRANEISLALEIPPQFGRAVARGGPTELSAVVDGANPARAETIAAYATSVVAGHVADVIRRGAPLPDLAKRLPSIEPRFLYNPAFESKYAIVPSIPATLLMLLPAILTAVSVVREKELGSIVNFYVTPTTRLEFLLCKQLPTAVIALVAYMLLVVVAVTLFGVPLRGHGPMLTACACLYVLATTAIGLVIASFTSSQVAAVFATAIVTMLPTIQFSGLFQPVSTLVGQARVIGTLWPTTYFLHASVGAFTKGLDAPLLAADALALAAFVPVLLAIARALLPRQEV